MQRFRIFLATLLVATVIWGALCYGSIQEWRRYVKDFYEECWMEKQRLEAEGGLIVDYGLAQVYWEWNGGGIIFVAGIVLLFAWILTAGEKLLEPRKGN